ncbi:MAG: serine protease [Gemmatales bacterium]|nr:serine protease [Gemmatales bacterium]MDW8387347.1 serine protease [Gemmatales bacterium]
MLGCAVAAGIVLVVAAVGVFLGYLIYETQRDNRNQGARVQPPPKGPGFPGGGPFGPPGMDPDLLRIPLWKWDAQDVARMEMILSTGAKPELLTYESPAANGGKAALQRVALENPVPTLTEKEQQETVMAADGSLPRDVLERVERATVRLRVTRPASPAGPPFQGEGSGFFALAPGIVVTNAHVVGLKQPGSPPPGSITVFVNSGEADEKQLQAKVLHADGHLDLALLQVDAKGVELPEPLKVVSASTLFRTQLLVAFGFPYGENLNTRMSTSKVSVASFVRDGKDMYRIQMNGELNPGNSGGPVVDAQGRVVGVAVSIYVNFLRNTGISFAVPAEHVWQLYHGRFGDLILGMPQQQNGGILLPVSLEVSDPLHRFTELGVAWSIGDAEAKQSAGWVTDLPAENRLALPADRAIWRRGVLKLPPLPDNQVYHLRAYVAEKDGTYRVSNGVTYRPALAVQTAQAALKSPADADSQARRLLARYRVVQRGGEAGSPTPLTVNLGCRTELDAKGTPERYLGFDLGVRVGERPLPRPLVQAILNQQNAQGNVQAQGNEPRFAAAGEFRGELAGLHRVVDQIFSIFQVPEKENELRPGRSWNATVSLAGDPLSVQEPMQFNVSYTPDGLAERAGKKLVCIRFSGDAVPGKTMTQGALHGIMWIDPATRLVVEARAYLDAVMELTYPEGPEKDAVAVSAAWSVDVPDRN